MKINSIFLQDFKCHKSLGIIFQGKNGKISGSNGVGKSAVFDAYNWLLFDKDSNGNSDFEIKPKENGVLLPLTTPTVTIEFDVCTLKKAHIEKWTKKRGEEEKTFEGYTTQYFIDDLEVKKKDFDNKIKELFDEKYFKILSNPLFFNTQLHWTERKKMLEQLAGSIDIEKILENPKYAELKEQQKKYTEEQIKELVKQEKKKFDKDVQELPVQIETLSSTLIEVDSKEQIEKLISVAEEKIKRKNQEIMQENSNLINAEVQNEIQIFNKKINEIESAKQQKKNAIEKEKRELQNLEGDAEYYKKNYTEAGNTIIQLEKERKQLLEKYNTEKSRKNEAVIEKNCPLCKQELPQDEIEKKIQEINENFETEKSKSLEKIVSEGKKLKEKIEEMSTKEKTDENKYLETIEKIKEKEIEIDKLNIELSEIEDIEQYKEKTKELEKDLYSKNDEKINKLKEELRILQENYIAAKVKLEKIKETETTKNKIEEMKKRLKDGNEKLMKILKIENQLKDFSFEKSIEIEKNVNKLFSDNINFKLFEEKLNGNIEETCICLCGKDKVEFNSHNTAGKVQIGLEIIDVICKKNNLSSIVWIDNREGIIDLPKTSNQIISLCVVENQNQIKVEVE
jgi:DNA repair protein SbcC/Rad50